MKILKKLLNLLWIAAVVIACEEPKGTGNDPVINKVSHYFEANLDVKRISQFPLDHPPVILSVSYQGRGNSTLMPNVILEASHIEEFATVFEDGDFLVKEGQFILRGETGDEIYGSYTGYGSQSHTNFYVSWTFHIEGGTGRFATAQGNLNVKFGARNGGNPKPQGPWHAEISGSIKLDATVI